VVSIEPIATYSTVVGENPLWDVDENRIYWIDVAGKKILRAAPDGRDVEVWEAPLEIGSMCLRKHGGAVVALEKGLHFFDFATGRYDPIADPEEGQPALRLNDGKVDARGRLIVGSYDKESYDPASPSVALQSRASLFRLDPDLSLHTLDTGIACVNGPCWTPDQRHFYFADTVPGVIWVAEWDAEKGQSVNKRRFLTCDPADGMADGATVDAEGFYWCAFFGAGAIRRYAPDGSIDRIIKLPVLKTTSLIFGGAELDTIYVTTMGNDFFPPADGPLGGRLFAIRGLGIRGVAERRFAG
jgi:sugar lactone lactonase YvrE